jgi:EVE domain
MASWIFKCSPEQYCLSARLADQNPTISWRVTRYREEIARGDTVFIWETGPDRGIRAVIQIESVPRETAELETEQKYNVERDTEIMWRVLGRLTHRGVNLSHAVLRAVPGLENLSVFRKDVFQQTTNFPVTPEEGAILLRLIEGGRA